MASKKNASVKANGSKVTKAADKVAQAKRDARNLARRNKRAADKAQTQSAPTETWAVGTQVEHPAHGVGVVSGHTQTDGVVLVDFTGAPDAIETVADELKLASPKPHKPHSAKKFNFPKRKHAEKAAKKVEDAFGSAREQHAAYAKRARKYAMNDRVVELGGHEREGNVFTVAPEGSAYLTVLFDGETVATTKHICDLKKVDMTKHKIVIGDLVAFKSSPTELIGTVESAHFTNGTCLVKVEDRVVGVAQLLDNLVVWQPPKFKEETTKFENLPLLSGFEYKGSEHVKVGNTSAIITTIDRETNGGAGKTIPMIRLSEFGIESASVNLKVRLKKDARVKPIVSMPFGLESLKA